MDTESTWQPVLVILRNGGRLECECGAKAMIVIGDLDTRARDTVEGVDYWCQDCYHKAQLEEMEK